MSYNSTLTNSMLRKEKAFRDEIEWNETNAMSFASRLATGGMLEGLLGDENMQNYRQSLKEIAQENVDKGRQLTAYMNAVKVLAQQNDADVAEDDIQAKLEQSVKKEREKIDRQSIDVTQETKYLDLCRELGDDQGSGDDDIAIVQNENDEHAFKCPLTGALMEDPVKNKVCKHSYSRAAIMQHIQSSSKKCVCPVAACTNKHVSASQLEPDKVMEANVRRFKRRKELSQKSQYSALDVDEEDDDE
jgi:Zinc-finger of the MIZ type in Nse subunit